MGLSNTSVGYLNYPTQVCVTIFYIVIIVLNVHPEISVLIVTLSTSDRFYINCGASYCEAPYIGMIVPTTDINI